MFHLSYHRDTLWRFFTNILKCCFRPSWVLLKLCRLILGCNKKLSSFILGKLESSWIYHFCLFPKNLRPHCLSKIMAFFFFLGTQNPSGGERSIHEAGSSIFFWVENFHPWYVFRSRDVSCIFFGLKKYL